MCLLGSKLTAQTSNGFHINRGITTLCPNVSSLQATFSQGMGIGIFRNYALSKNSSFQTGLNYNSLRSCQVIQMDGMDIFIPEKYNYLEVPFILEKNHFFMSRRSRKSISFRTRVGISASYQQHEADYTERTGAFNTRSLNYGILAGLQWSKELNWKTAFAFGPEIRFFSTGQDHTPFASYAAVRLDWRFR